MIFRVYHLCMFQSLKLAKLTLMLAQVHSQVILQILFHWFGITSLWILGICMHRVDDTDVLLVLWQTDYNYKKGKLSCISFIKDLL